MNINLPTTLTLLRICLIPAFILFFYLPVHWGHPVAAIIFMCAALTDWLDGYLARSLKQTTKFGAFLDPVADKLMVALALVLVVGEFGMIYVTLPAAVIIGREIVVSALREWMSEIGKRTSVTVGKIAKVKTALQMASLLSLLIYTPGGEKNWQITGITLLYVAAVLTLWSMTLYLKAAWLDLTISKDKR